VGDAIGNFGSKGEGEKLYLLEQIFTSDLFSHPSQPTRKNSEKMMHIYTTKFWY
jgi:hypothetical protein